MEQTIVRSKKPRAVVGPARRPDDGSALCRVRIPFDHPTEVVTLTGADGHACQVDYDPACRAGPGRTVVRRRDRDGKATPPSDGGRCGRRGVRPSQQRRQHRNERPVMEFEQAVGVRFDVEELLVRRVGRRERIDGDRRERPAGAGRRTPDRRGVRARSTAAARPRRHGSDAPRPGTSRAVSGAMAASCAAPAAASASANGCQRRRWSAQTRSKSRNVAGERRRACV